MIGKIFKYTVAGLLALIGIGIAFSLIGFVVGLAVKVGILAAIGFGVYKLIGGGGPPKNREREISAEDRKWLES